MEVCVQVSYGTRTVIVAYGIFERARTVVYAVYEVVPQKEGQRAVDGRLVHRVQCIVQVCQRQRLPGLHHGVQHQQADGCWLYVSSRQHIEVFLFVFHI